jgi:hypothetical protein
MSRGSLVAPLRKPLVTRLILFTVFAMLASAPAYAYLDPGTGSILVQALLAALAAGSAAVAAFWSQIRRFISGRRKAAPPDAEAEDDSSPS